MNKLKEYANKSFYISSYEITVKEMIASVTLMCLMMILGMSIASKIDMIAQDNIVKYKQAVHIQDDEMFQYALDTNRGYAFVNSNMKALDPVSIKDIDGEYMYIRKEKYVWTEYRHTKCDDDGDCEVYYTYDWEYRNKEEWNSKQIEFGGIEFKYKNVDKPSSKYHSKNEEASGWSGSRKVGDIKYEYYVRKTNYKGTMFANLRDGELKENSFYSNKTTQETLDNLIDSEMNKVLIFWFVWILVICGAIYYFCILENKWLH